MKMVLVQWLDHVSVDEWVDVESLKKEKAADIWSGGILVGESDDHVILSLNKDTTNDKASCTMVIHKALILYMAVVAEF